MYLNGEKIVDNNGCHGETEKSSQDKFLGPNVHSLVVERCAVGGGEAFKMRYEGPDTGNSKITVPMSAIKHDAKALNWTEVVAQSGLVSGIKKGCDKIVQLLPMPTGS